jgi:hypothetical protein
MALKRVWIPSPNYSSRGGANVRLIVLHTAEGARTIESLGNFFSSASAGVSSQVGIDDQAGKIGEYVKRQNKSWTQSEFNPVATSAELCGFASWTRSEWLQNHANMLSNAAAWIAEESAHFGVPIQKLSASAAQGSGRGVCQHVDLGARGGGHHDCGAGFPIDDVLQMARGGAGPSTSTEEGDMVASCVADNGSLHVFWLGTDRVNVWYRWQRRGETKWNDGGVLAKSSEKLAGLSATVTSTGTMELFARQDDGGMVHLWQKAGESSWSGGEAGKSKAGFTTLPK